MKDLRLVRVNVTLLLLASALPIFAQTKAYHYYRVGNPADVAGAARPGFALMGGGADLDEAFRLDGPDAELFRYRGDCQLCLREYEKAATDFSSALSLEPEMALAHRALVLRTAWPDSAAALAAVLGQHKPGAPAAGHLC